MSISKFFAFSILLHVVILVAVYFIPMAKEEQQKEFITKLVSPEELRKPEIRLPERRIKSLSHLPPVLEKQKPNLLPPAHPIRPEPAHEKPDVPGEGKETGKPLPEGTYPESGRHEGEETATGKLSRSKPLEKPGYLENKNLFDRGTIDEIAKKGISEKKGEDKTITLDTSEYKYLGYKNLLRNKIETSGCWVYPPDAAAKGIYGDLIIRFTIKKNGRLGAVELVRTSGHKSLDDAAFKALKDCEPYWPLPDKWKMEAYTIEGHFIYTVYGYFIK